MVMNSLNNTSGLWFMMTELSITYDRLNDVLIQELESNEILNSKKKLSQFNIYFNKVSFKYNEISNKKAINKLSLKIDKGERIGIIGRNGSGKSTLAKLLIGLYSNYEGQILVDNTPLRDIYLPELRAKIHLFPQEIYLFDASIKENIQYGNLNSNMEDIIRAAKLADIHDFISDNYLGYNLSIGENGVNLSGGEKLKIAFARLFLANPEIIILDEASSALDIETENTITQNLFNHFKGKTIITIAHRMNTLINSDIIYVMDNGSIIEKGNHTDLLNKEGMYYHFMKMYLDI